MKFLRAALPNLTIALNLALAIVIYLDMRNPMMGFLIGPPFAVLAISCVVCSLASAIVLYCSWRKRVKESAQNQFVP